MSQIEKVLFRFIRRFRRVRKASARAVTDSIDKLFVSARRTAGSFLASFGSPLAEFLLAGAVSFFLADVVDFPAVFGVRFQPRVG